MTNWIVLLVVNIKTDLNFYFFFSLLSLKPFLPIIVINEFYPQVQKLSMKSLPITQPAEPEPAAAAPAAEADNSLLVVRYEENVSTEEPQPR